MLHRAVRGSGGMMESEVFFAVVHSEWQSHNTRRKLKVGSCLVCIFEYWSTGVMAVLAGTVLLFPRATGLLYWDSTCSLNYGPTFKLLWTNPVLKLFLITSIICVWEPNST